MILLAGGVADVSKRSTEYIALFDNIIHRMRFSKFITVVSEELDKEVNVSDCCFPLIS